MQSKFETVSAWLSRLRTLNVINPLFNTIASDVPGGNRILIINIKAQQSALSKAIKTRFNLKIYFQIKPCFDDFT